MGIIPDTPFSVMTRSGLNSRILSHNALTCSSSICRTLFQSVSLLISMLVCDSPFLYSKGQSKRMIRGCLLSVHVNIPYILDTSSHFGMRDILVQHDSI